MSDWREERDEGPCETTSRQPGFIYVLHCPAFAGLAKIGMTTRSPWERAAELSGATALPEPFELTRAFPVFDAAKAERLCHRELSRYRHRTSREFFLDSWLEGPSGRVSTRAVMVEFILDDAKLLDERMAFHDDATRAIVEAHKRLCEGDVGLLAERVEVLEREAVDHMNRHAAERAELERRLAEADGEISRLRSSELQRLHMISILRDRMTAAGLTPV